MIFFIVIIFIQVIKLKKKQLIILINLFTFKKFDYKYKINELRKIYNKNIKLELLNIVNKDNFNIKIILFKEYLKKSLEKEISKYYGEDYVIESDIPTKIFNKINMINFKKHEYIQIDNFLFRVIYTTLTNRYYTLIESINIYKNQLLNIYPII